MHCRATPSYLSMSILGSGHTEARSTHKHTNLHVQIMLQRQYVSCRATPSQLEHVNFSIAGVTEARAIHQRTNFKFPTISHSQYGSLQDLRQTSQDSQMLFINSYIIRLESLSLDRSPMKAPILEYILALITR